MLHNLPLWVGFVLDIPLVLGYDFAGISILEILQNDWSVLLETAVKELIFHPGLTTSYIRYAQEKSTY